MKTSLTSKDLDLILTAAGRAPSGGNIQPWLVEVNQNRITTKLNPQKLGMILDVNNYGSLFALGAFILNLEIAASHLGWQTEAKVLHLTDANQFSVEVIFNHKQKSSPHPLYEAIQKRNSNRHLSNGQLIDNAIIEKLRTLVSDEDPLFQLDTVSNNDDKNQVATILGVADRIRTKNYTLLSQMMSEIRWTEAEVKKTKDGLDIKTMELPGNVAKMLQLLSKFSHLAKTMPNIALEKQAWPLLKGCSHLCLMSFNSPHSPLCFYSAGRTMQRLWLETTNLGLALHPWTVLTFFIIRAQSFPGTGFTKEEEKNLLHLSQQLKNVYHLKSNATPAFIFRLSYANSPSGRSLRYDWRQFTTLKTQL